MNQVAIESTVKPPRLQAGDNIAIVAPSGPVDSQRLQKGLDLLSPYFTPVVRKDVFAREEYLAGSDARRIDEWNEALCNPDIRALWVARGGYGAMRILPHLDVAAFKADPKPIIGFSDATALLYWALSAGVRPVHGPVVSQLGDVEEADVKWVMDILLGQVRRRQWSTQQMRCDTVSPNIVEGRLIGGNLCVLTHLVGTPYEMAAVTREDVILVVEDIGERPYALDRYVTHLGLSGRLDYVKAWIGGEFSHCFEPKDQNQQANTALQRAFSSYSIPGFLGAPVGHGTRNQAFVVGNRCSIDLGSGVVSLDEDVLG